MSWAFAEVSTFGGFREVEDLDSAFKECVVYVGDTKKMFAYGPGAH